jgi:hypothetical protein
MLESEVRGDAIVRQAGVTDSDIESWAAQAAHYRAVADGAAAHLRPRVPVTESC